MWLYAGRQDFSQSTQQQCRRLPITVSKHVGLASDTTTIAVGVKALGDINASQRIAFVRCFNARDLTVFSVTAVTTQWHMYEHLTVAGQLAQPKVHAPASTSRGLRAPPTTAVNCSADIVINQCRKLIGLLRLNLHVKSASSPFGKWAVFIYSAPPPKKITFWGKLKQFFTGRMPSYEPSNSVKAPKGTIIYLYIELIVSRRQWW